MQPREPRYRVGGVNFVYTTDEGSWTAPVVDLSQSGIFLETPHQLVVGTRVTLVPEVPEHEMLPFEIIGEVTRISEIDADTSFARPPGIAFRLVNLEAAHYTALKRFLEQRGALVRPPRP